jgi:hypothetical protein
VSRFAGPTIARYSERMQCTRCEDEVSELVKVKVGKKAQRVCESCADALREEAEVAEGAEEAMQGMMEYKGRR